MTNKEFIESIRMDGEEFKPVIGYEDLYMISSYGRLYSVHRKCASGKGYCIVKGGKIKKPQKNKDGYLKVQLVKDYKTKNHFIHRLVATAFIPNPLNLPTIDHIDTNKVNNNVSNLKWCTRKDNSNNILTRQLLSKVSHFRQIKGSAHPESKPIVRISPDGSIKKYPCIGDTIKDGFCRSSVGRTCSGKYNQHKGYLWMYLSDYEKLINTSKNSLSTKDD